MKSIHARFKHNYVKTCKCGIKHEVKEFKELLINDSGKIQAECKECGEDHTFHLTTNVDGAELSAKLKMISYSYDED